MSLIESFGWKQFWEKIILSITANTQLAAIFKTAPKALISAFRCVWSEKDLHSAGRGASRSRTAYPCKKEASTVENFRALASGKERQGKDWWKAARGNQPHRVVWPSGLRHWIEAPVSLGAWVRIPPLPGQPSWKTLVAAIAEQRAFLGRTRWFLWRISAASVASISGGWKSKKKKRGSVAEWSKALDLGSSLSGGVGSNPTAASSGLTKAGRPCVYSRKVWKYCESTFPWQCLQTICLVLSHSRSPVC